MATQAGHDKLLHDYTCVCQFLKNASLPHRVAAAQMVYACQSTAGFSLAAESQSVWSDSPEAPDMLHAVQSVFQAMCCRRFVE
jgi:hypothetical protein